MVGDDVRAEFDGVIRYLEIDSRRRWIRFLEFQQSSDDGATDRDAVIGLDARRRWHAHSSIQTR
jgi:hypothetical protein